MVHKENPRTNSLCLILAEGLILPNPCLISIWNVCQHVEQCGEEVFNVLNCEATWYEIFFSTAGSSVWKMKLKSYATDKDFLVGIFLFENSFVQSRLNLLLRCLVFFFGLKSAYVIISGYAKIVNINSVFM